MEDLFIVKPQCHQLVKKFLLMEYQCAEKVMWQVAVIQPQAAKT
jgi:hypothetical protein